MDGLNIVSGFLFATYTIRKHRDRFRVNVRRDGRVVADDRFDTREDAVRWLAEEFPGAIDATIPPGRV